MHPTGWRPRWLGTIRVRILAVVVLLLFVASGGSVVLLRSVLLDRLDQEVTESLEREAEEFRLLSTGNDPRTGRPFDGDVRAVFDAYFAREIPDEGESLLAFVDGRLHESRRAQDAYDADAIPDATEFWLSLEEPDSGVVTTAVGEARYVAVPLPGRDGDGDGLFVVANFPSFERTEIDGAVGVHIGIQVLTLTVASALGAVLAGRVLRPLARLASTARTISDTDLSLRIPSSGRDEASMIAAAFNDMLGRLELAITAQRRFLDDTSHDLRTPLTVIRGHVELLELDGSPAARRETVALVLDEVDRLSRMVDDLFLLAHARHPDFLRRERLDLGALLHDVHRKVTALGERRWLVDTDGQVLVDGDPQRLTQAIMQLVANAVRHTAAGDSVSLSASVRDGRAVVAVTDSGPGVDPADAERIFTRFDRGRAAGPAGGAGIGLAVVRAIAEAHRGTARLVPTEGSGARFELLLPLATDRRPVDSGLRR